MVYPLPAEAAERARRVSRNRQAGDSCKDKAISRRGNNALVLLMSRSGGLWG
jgi:hypothetical protein